MIPEEALEAAIQAIVMSLPNNADLETHRPWATGYAQAAIEAAAPFIQAMAKREAWDEVAVWVAAGNELFPGAIQAANPYRTGTL